MPHGYIASGDGYKRRYDEIITDVPIKTKCVNNLLLWAETLEDSFYQVVHWLYVCGRNSITLNLEKFVLDANRKEGNDQESTQSPNTFRPRHRKGKRTHLNQWQHNQNTTDQKAKRTVPHPAPQPPYPQPGQTAI